MDIKNKEVENAIKILLKWLGDNPNREGLIKTPQRVLERYKDIFSGYHTNLQSILEKPTLACKKGMGMVTIPHIKFISFCEHHLLPMIGEINIGYLPSQKLSGIGTLMKLVNIFTHRLQIQENLTIQIAEAIEKYLQPKGVAVAIQADHYCVDSKETGALSSKLSTHHFLGTLQTDQKLQKQFLSSITPIEL